MVTPPGSSRSSLIRSTGIRRSAEGILHRRAGTSGRLLFLVMRSGTGCLAPSFDEGHERVVVNVEHRADAACGIALVAPGQIPGDWDAEPVQLFDYGPVAPIKLVGGQPAAQRVVDVRVGPGLIEDQVAALEQFKESGDSGKKALCSPRPTELPGRAVMDDLALTLQMVDDVLRAVAPVLVEVEDAHLQ